MFNRVADNLVIIGGYPKFFNNSGKKNFKMPRTAKNMHSKLAEVVDVRVPDDQVINIGYQL